MEWAEPVYFLVLRDISLSEYPATFMNGAAVRDVLGDVTLRQGDMVIVQHDRIYANGMAFHAPGLADHPKLEPMTVVPGPRR